MLFLYAHVLAVRLSANKTDASQLAKALEG